MAFDDWQIEKLRSALRAYKAYGKDGFGKRLTWAVVAGQIEADTEVEFTPEVLRQFVEGVSKKANPARRRVPDLMTIEPGGKAPIKLTQTPYEEWRPAPAGDGTVFFIANPRGQFDVFALAPGSHEPKLVFGSHADEWDPAVSPDSRWLTFASKATGHWNLMLLDRKTGAARAITTGVQNDWDPQFHPGGKFIAFGRSTGREPMIFGMCAFGESQS